MLPNRPFVIDRADGTKTYVIQGNIATLPEYNVAVALDRLGFEYVYAAGGIEEHIVQITTEEL